MPQCAKCGKTVKSGAAFCPTCGADMSIDTQPEHRPAGGQALRQEKKRPATAEKPVRKKKKRTAVGPVVALILVLMLVGAILLITGLNRRKQSAALDAYVQPEVAQNGPVSAPLEQEVTGAAPQADDATSREQSGNEGGVLIPEQTPTTLIFKSMQYGPREARITLGNLLETCAGLNTTNPKFAYRVQMKFPEDYIITGGFQCLTGANEKTPIKITGDTLLTREGKSIPGIVSAVAGDDSITLVLNMADWTGFYFDQVEYYDLSMWSLADPALAEEHIYTPAEVKTINYLDANLPQAHIQIDVPDENQLTIRLTDDLLQDGYLNSPTKGSKTPVWEIKICESSYKWISVTLDGTHGEPVDSMTVTAKQMFSEKRDGANAATFDGVSYTVVDNTMVIAIQLPEDAKQSIYRMKWLEANLRDGKDTRKIRLMELD